MIDWEVLEELHEELIDLVKNSQNTMEKLPTLKKEKAIRDIQRKIMSASTVLIENITLLHSVLDQLNKVSYVIKEPGCAEEDKVDLILRILEGED